VRACVRECGRVLLSPSPIGQASRHAGKRVSFAPSPLPQSQFRVLRSGRKI
jgi:hypothetical protein